MTDHADQDRPGSRSKAQISSPRAGLPPPGRDALERACPERLRDAEHGEITEEEMEAAYRRAKARAVVVRGGQVVDDKGTGVA
jgi:hypothetical protein